MLVVLAISHIARQGVQALPISKSAHDLDLSSTPNHCHDLRQCRTIEDIIWSCVVTIFASTWITLHLNIPAPEEKWHTIVLRKVGIMALALIAPEVVVMWAMRQWLVACRIAKKYKAHGWTETHGFFALMGGFMRSDGVRGPYTLSPEDLRSHLQEGDIDITEKAIKDRSKGDILSRGVVILQTGWFILQFFARISQHLPVTELEVVTLAFAILNFTTYWLWWNKPLNVQVPFLISKQPTSDQGDKEGGEHIEGEDEGDGWVMFKRVAASMWDTIRSTIVCKVSGAIKNTIELIRNVLVALENAIQSIRNVRRTIRSAAQHVADRRGPSESWTAWNVLEFMLFAPLLLFIPVLVLIDMLHDMGTGGGDDDIKPESKRVGTFYSGKLKRSEQACVVFVAGLFATIFGAIHCIAWSFLFPTQTEQLLWRISSLSITCVPLCLLAMAWQDSIGWPNSITPVWVGELLELTSLVLYALVLILYVLARITLLVTAFMSLRSLPPKVYQTVRWTTFIAHVSV